MRKPALVQLLNKHIIFLHEIVDQVYKDLYDQLRDRANDSELLVLSIYSLVDNEINRLDDMFSKQFPEHISKEELSKEELKEMKEELTAQADFMPVPGEELDEPFYTSGKYDLMEILTDAESEDEIFKLAESGDINIEELVQELPVDKQSVFELYYLYHLDTEEIALLLKSTENEVQNLIKEGREKVKDHFKQHA
jgi:RNA polymerase sigma factor (sigma-70 family)